MSVRVRTKVEHRLSQGPKSPPIKNGEQLKSFGGFRIFYGKIPNFEKISHDPNQKIPKESWNRNEIDKIDENKIKIRLQEKVPFDKMHEHKNVTIWTWWLHKLKTNLFIHLIWTKYIAGVYIVFAHTMYCRNLLVICLVLVLAFHLWCCCCCYFNNKYAYTILALFAIY